MYLTYQWNLNPLKTSACNILNRNRINSTKDTEVICTIQSLSHLSASDINRVQITIFSVRNYKTSAILTFKKNINYKVEVYHSHSKSASVEFGSVNKHFARLFICVSAIIVQKVINTERLECDVWVIPKVRQL